MKKVIYSILIIAFVSGSAFAAKPSACDKITKQCSKKQAGVQNALDNVSKNCEKNPNKGKGCTNAKANLQAKLNDTRADCQVKIPEACSAK